MDQGNQVENQVENQQEQEQEQVKAKTPGRPKTYLTDEERLQALNENSKRYYNANKKKVCEKLKEKYHKRKQEQVFYTLANV